MIKKYNNKINCTANIQKQFNRFSEKLKKLFPKEDHTWCCARKLNLFDRGYMLPPPPNEAMYLDHIFQSAMSIV